MRNDDCKCSDKVNGEKVYRVNEIFYSLQGEGFHTGCAAVFVRFAGCNLRCPFCDTDFSSSEPMSAEQISAKVFAFSTDPCTLIVLTGGEPSLQADEPLIAALHRHGQRVAVETNGTHRLPKAVDWVTVSPKAGAVTVLDHADEVKIVFTPETEPELPAWRQAIQASHYYLQPCSCANTQDVVDYILRHPEWRLSLQTHKYIEIK